MMTRRHALKTAALASAGIATMRRGLAQSNTAAAPRPDPLQLIVSGPFTLPPLPYELDALEPHIDARTMQIHHDKHHKAYVDNLNKAVAEFPEVAKENVETLLMNLNSVVPEKIRTAVRNNGGGHYNHSLFWQMMKKDGGGEPKGNLATAIHNGFGGFANFKDQFTKAALGQFGSGWAWLIANVQTMTLAIVATPNQDTPLFYPRSTGPGYADASLHGATMPFPAVSGGLPNACPLLGLDVWEHAYYLKYQNKRADYIAAWWNVVNWDFVAERYSKLK